MKSAVLISMIIHVIAVAGVVWGSERGNRQSGPPVRVYGVELVGFPQGLGGLGAAHGEGEKSLNIPQTEVVRPRVRTGLKVKRAPSNEPSAPKGTKKPARRWSQRPGKEGASPSRGGQGPGGSGGGMRLEGEPFPFPDYIKDVKSRILSRWEEPMIVGKQGILKATVFFRIRKDGMITESLVEAGSGVLVFDRAAFNAVAWAGPLAPLPDGYQSDQLGVHFDFEN